MPCKPGCSVGDAVAAVRLGTWGRLVETDVHAEHADRTLQRHVCAGEAAVQRVADAVAVSTPMSSRASPSQRCARLESPGRSPSSSTSQRGRESISSCSAARRASSEVWQQRRVIGVSQQCLKAGVGVRARCRDEITRGVLG